MMIIATIFSCDKYDEIHEDYVDNMEEIKYSVIPENVIIHSGLERLYISADILYTSSLNKFVVDCEGEIKEIDIPAPINDTSKLYEEIPYLKEGVVDLYVYTTDNQDNKSLVKLYTGRVLGERYRSEILNRNVLDTASTDDGFKIRFITAPETSVRMDFSYTDSNNVAQILRIPSDTTEVKFTDYKKGSEYSYVTYYLPDENAIDTIATASQINGLFPE